MSQNSDFEYEPKDARIMKTAFLSLQEDEVKGFWLGVGAGLAAAILAKKAKNFQPISVNLIGLATGALTYNLYTHRARTYYAKLATIANINANNAINRVMKY